MSEYSVKVKNVIEFECVFSVLPIYGQTLAPFFAVWLPVTVDNFSHSTATVPILVRTFYFVLYVAAHDQPGCSSSMQAITDAYPATRGNKGASQIFLRSSHCVAQRRKCSVLMAC